MKRLDKVLTVCALMVVFSVALATLKFVGIASQHRHVESEIGKYKALRNGVAQRIEDLQYLDKNHTEFDRLIVEPAGSAKRKVAWAKRLDSAQSILSVPIISFEIFPLKEFSNVQNQLVAAYEQIELELGMRHETQLVNFLSYLDENTPGSLSVYSLEVERLDSLDNDPIDRDAYVNLQVSCILRWYTFYSEETHVGES